MIISNCVINLSVDKDAALREAFRVLKPGGRFAVSDVVIRGDAPAEIRRSMELWVGCVAGALRDDDYVSKLQAAGFMDVELDPWRVYQIEDARTFLAEAGVDVDAIASQSMERSRARSSAHGNRKPRHAAGRRAAHRSETDPRFLEVRML